MSPSIPDLGTTLEERIDALHAWPAGEALPEAAEEVVAELLGRLEAGSLRSAVREGDGSWAAVPWVKRGILVAFRSGRVTPVAAPGEQRGRRPGSIRLPGQAQPARAPLQLRGGRPGGAGRLGRAPRGLPRSRGGVHAADVRERGRLGGGGQHDRLARPGGLVRPDRGARASERGGPGRRRAGARGGGPGGDRGRRAGGRQCGRLRGDGGAPRGGAGRRSHPDARAHRCSTWCARRCIAPAPPGRSRFPRTPWSSPGGARSPASGAARRGCRCMPRSS